jgi:hypothetical protein
MSILNPPATTNAPGLTIPTLGSSISQGSVSSLTPLSAVPGPAGPSLRAIDPNDYLAMNSTLQALSASVAQQIQDGNRGNNPYGVTRRPWVFATFDDIRKAGISPNDAASGNLFGPNSIMWAANPKSVTWQISQRGSESKNKSGTVLHVYRDRIRQSDYDDPKLNIQFQSGSILPQLNNATNPSTKPGDTPPDGISYGLNNFYQFLQLVDQPKISSTGDANVIHILYRSRIFPSIVITGFFDPQVVVQFTDDSQNPAQINGWSANFTVYSTTPKLKKFSDLLSMFTKEGLTGF